MSFQDPTTGDKLIGANASIPPLVDYGSSSTLYPPTGSEKTAKGAQVGAEMEETFEATPESSTEDFEAPSLNVRRVGLIAGVIVAGLATGAGIAWFVISRRRAQQARIAELAQGRGLLGVSPAEARQRLSEALESGAALSSRAWQSARDMRLAASALTESAITRAQDARERATLASQLLRDQTVNVSQAAQERLTDTWGRTRDTATTSWDAAAQTAHRARIASIRTARSARIAARMAAHTARIESKRTAKTARAGIARAQRVATR
jgi:hypothetical protein